MGPLHEFAAAKVNLTLRVIGRRPDGYHELESLVVFADIGDRLMLRPGDALALTIDGPTAASAGAIGDNLVLKAANALAKRASGLTCGHFHLTKELPAAAGIGGGSSDAAAALRLLARANAIAFDDERLMEAAVATGADVPVCLTQRPRVMRGIGDILDAPLDLEPLPAVLVNPGVGVSTRDVFAALRRIAPSAQRRTGSADALEAGNDLEAPAVSLQPVIAEVLAALARAQGCRLARMSGSGATCFGLFASAAAADAAAARLRAAQPAWWIRATTLGAAPLP